MVMKPSGKWKICTNYIDLNKACSKDLYPLHSIDALVDEESSCDLLSFMDAYLGYNQIQMHPCDESKTVFMMDEEVYVDNMVKSEMEGGHVDNLSSIFGVLKRYQLKLNPKKCSFGVRLVNHPVVCRTDLPIRKILRKPDLAGRMIWWAVELSQFDVAYERRGHMKAQVLADFINELTSNPGYEKAFGKNKEWTLSIDNSSNKRGNKVGVILEELGGVLIEQSLHFDFQASNKYEALLARIRLAKELRAERLTIKSDS
ncbi:hypothetical protein CR513_05434, partial [Mucuna pruriens]